MASARLRALWDHPAGVKTIFFWAPTMKWGLVLASLSDMQRPPETVSVPQCSALALTGCVWARWSFVIIPLNYNLALSNIFVAGTNIYQLSRVFRARGGSGELSGEGSVGGDRGLASVGEIAGGKGQVDK